MDTTERMMIMGMCLQGLLANPDLSRNSIESNIKLAHRYADALDPPPALTAAQTIMALTRTAYGVLRAADAEGAGKWPSFDDARTSMLAQHADDLDGVFERVSRWFHDPTGYPETLQDRIIAAVVAAHQGGL